MKPKIIFVVILLSIIYLGNNCAQQENSPVLKGPYLGQKPPGMIPEIFAPQILSTGSHELDVTISPDGEEIFFTRSGPDWFSAILQFKLIDGVWHGPLMPPFSGRYQNNYPFVSPGGTKIFYNSQEPVPPIIEKNTNNNIFTSELTDKGWSRGRLLDKSLAVNHTESYVSVSASGNIYFGARYENGLGGCDFYMCEFKDGEYKKAVNLGSPINSKHDEFHLFIAPDESYIIFDARKPEGFGGNDLYISFKTPDGTWCQPTNLGNKINTEYSESRPYISPDGKYLFFCSSRISSINQDENKILKYEDFEKRINGPGNGNQDIYWVDAKIIEELK